MLGERLPYEIFSQKFSEGKNFFENSFYVENSDKYCDCWMGFNKEFSEPYWYGLTPDGKTAMTLRLLRKCSTPKCLTAVQ